MQISVFKIFSNIRYLFMLMLLLAVLLAATIISEYSSFYKLQNLQKEKELASAIYTLGRDDIELANVQFRGKSSMLKHEGAALSNYYEYDYINQFMQTGNYQNEIVKLKYAINDFNKAAEEWFTQEPQSEEELLKRKAYLSQTYGLLMEQINAITTDNVHFEQKRFQLQEVLVLAILVLTLFLFVWTSLRLSQIRSDIKALYTRELEETAKFNTLEASEISKYAARSVKGPTTQNPAYLDAVTGINNYKGLIHEFAEKKTLKIGNYTAVCIFAIDKLSEIEMQYSQEFSEAVLKKVSFMLSLYRQHNDMIGRIDHNQFIVVLSRPDKTSAFSDCDIIRKSVEGTPFKTSDGQKLTITLSGGFVQKQSTQSLEETITKAAKVLAMSVQHGGNRIAQLRDKNVSMK